MKWPEGQGGGAEVRNDFTISDPRGDRAVKRAELALLSKQNSITNALPNRLNNGPTD